MWVSIWIQPLTCCVTLDESNNPSDLRLLFCYVGTRVLNSRCPRCFTRCLVQLALNEALWNEWTNGWMSDRLGKAAEQMGPGAFLETKKREGNDLQQRDGKNVRFRGQRKANAASPGGAGGPGGAATEFLILIQFPLRPNTPRC